MAWLILSEISFQAKVVLYNHSVGCTIQSNRQGIKRGPKRSKGTPANVTRKEESATFAIGAEFRNCP